ncbi:hypothetical protein JCGZ_14157 [Jatropha curcas]|uniref:WAT1-related protein n=1 Tax=Jatropha curcas TaxID=180498 RepID=A0A067JWN8_JATCU|nr:WAT1-related protein At4g01440 isoform X1 [Jatropha curcas]KDP28386.1 hypothetical protein JCGZ_14157 [Jatropha curcas]
MGCREHLPVLLVIVSINFALGIVNVLLKKILDGGTNHMVIVTYRLSISAIFLAPIAYYSEREARPKLTVYILSYLFLAALVGATLTQYLFLLGLEYTSAAFSCAFLNTVPANTFILALPFGLEKVKLKGKAGRAKLLGAIICMTGAVSLALYKGIPLKNSDSYEDIKSHVEATMMSDKKTKSWVMGSVLLMGGSLLWSSWFLIQAKISERYPCQYSSTAILSLFGAIQSASISLILERNISAWILKGKLEIVTVIFSGMVASGLCYVGMAWCVKRRGPVFTAAFTPFIQIFAAIFDFSILHDQVYLGSVIGSVVVVVGLYILLWGKRKEAKECIMKQSLVKEGGNSDVESQAPVTIKSSSS